LTLDYVNEVKMLYLKLFGSQFFGLCTEHQCSDDSCKFICC